MARKNVAFLHMKDPEEACVKFTDIWVSDLGYQGMVPEYHPITATFFEWAVILTAYHTRLWVQKQPIKHLTTAKGDPLTFQHEFEMWEGRITASVVKKDRLSEAWYCSGLAWHAVFTGIGYDAAQRALALYLVKYNPKTDINQLRRDAFENAKSRRPRTCGIEDSTILPLFEMTIRIAESLFKALLGPEAGGSHYKHHLQCINLIQRTKYTYERLRGKHSYDWDRRNHMAFSILEACHTIVLPELERRVQRRIAEKNSLLFSQPPQRSELLR